MSYTVVNDYIMNMLESLGDDMNIGEFKKVWISKREEFENVLSQVAEPIGFPTQVGPQVRHQVGPQEPEPETEVRRKVNGKLPSEYVMFCRLHREEVKVNNPKMKGVDITRELARLWKIEKADRVKKPKEIENKVEIEIEKKPKKETKTRLKKVLTPSGLDVNFVDVESKQEGKQDGKQEGKEKKSEVKGKRKKVNKKENEKQSEEEYMIFCNENRLKIKEKHPDMNPLEVTRELAKKWKIHQLTTRDGIRNIIEQAIGN